MKKIFALVIISAILLSGCVGEKIRETPEATESSTETNVPQTNESLSVYMGFADSVVEFALPIFKQKYPDIPIEIIRPKTANALSKAADEETNMFFTSILAYGGPDLICTKSLVGTMDFGKIISNGVAADMSEFYDSDTELAQTLNKTVMDGGVTGGKRCFFPLDYSLPLLLTTQKMLYKYSLNEKNCPDFSSFLTEIEKITDIPIKATFLAHYSVMETASGINPADAENKVFNADIPEMKSSFEWLKKIALTFPKEKLGYWADIFPDDIKALLEENLLFLSDSGAVLNYPSLLHYGSLLSSVDETPVIFPIRNVSRGLTANVNNAAFVCANSPNKENAYKFIQILLSNEVQSHYLIRGNNNISVSRQAMDDYYTWQKDSVRGPVYGFPVERPSISRELHDKYLSYSDEINEVVLKDNVYGIRRLMMPFFLEGVSYEEAIATAKEEIEFRMSE